MTYNTENRDGPHYKLICNILYLAYSSSNILFALSVQIVIKLTRQKVCLNLMELVAKSCVSCLAGFYTLIMMMEPHYPSLRFGLTVIFSFIMTRFLISSLKDN